ncbi:uncharacterized protein [Oscarella lobularis]|uniref:uncharacterized protein isoform X2 n=1 Tax=Oscarella lobularis TaxID=121494 RepID=UPI0033130B31
MAKQKLDRKTSRDILVPYHDAAASVLTSGSSRSLEEAFMQAVAIGDLAKVQTILKQGGRKVRNPTSFPASFFRPPSAPPTRFVLPYRKNSMVDARYKGTGDTALIVAARKGFAKIVALLLIFGADATLQNDDDETAVDVTGKDEIRATITDSINRQGVSNRNLLQAAWQGDFSIVRQLLSKPFIDVNCRNAEGYTPLLLVTRDIDLFQKLESAILKNYRPADVVTHLIKHKADVTASDSDGRTAIHFAAHASGSFAQQIVALLLSEGTEIDIRDGQRNAPIHCASEAGSVPMIEYLLNSGANVNALGRDGSTPLHFSAEGGHEAAADILLDHGADITLANERGRTPVDVAKTPRLKNKLKVAWSESTSSLQKADKASSTETDVASPPTLSSPLSPDSDDARDVSSFFVTQNPVRSRRSSATPAPIKVIDMDREFFSGHTAFDAKPKPAPKSRQLSARKSAKPTQTSRGGKATKTLASAAVKTGLIATPVTIAKRHTLPKRGTTTGATALSSKPEKQAQYTRAHSDVRSEAQSSTVTQMPPLKQAMPLPLAFVAVGFDKTATVHRWNRASPSTHALPHYSPERIRSRPRSRSEPQTNLLTSLSRVNALIAQGREKQSSSNSPSCRRMPAMLQPISPTKTGTLLPGPTLERIASGYALGEPQSSPRPSPAYASPSASWRTPPSPNPWERNLEPELDHDAILTPVFSDFFVGDGDTLATAALSSSSSSTLRRTSSSPAPLNLTSSESSSTLEARPASPESEQSLPASVAFLRRGAPESPRTAALPRFLPSLRPEAKSLVAADCCAAAMPVIPDIPASLLLASSESEPETIVSFVGSSRSIGVTEGRASVIREKPAAAASEEGRAHSSGADSGNGDSDQEAGRVAAKEAEEEEEDDDDEEVIRWKKGNLLGQGAFGSVWCGLTDAGDMIAVKQVRLHNEVDKAEKQYVKLQAEVGLLRSLKHNNIVGYRATSFEEDTNTVNIFMEYIPGGSLAVVLQRFGPLQESVFRNYCRQILSGVAYLHTKSIVHRDIKGANCMLCPSGIIKLIDFGCAKQYCVQTDLSLSQSGVFKSMNGTPYWMAPEVITESGYGRKSDIWSVGCTTFEMATGKAPWSQLNPAAAIFQIGSGASPPRLPEKFSQLAIDFVARCLTRDKHERPSAAQLLQHPFVHSKR